METFGTPPPMGWVEDKELPLGVVKLATLNVGAASRVMEDDGHIRGPFVSLLEKLQESGAPLIMFLTEFRGKKDSLEDNRWGPVPQGENSIHYRDAKYKRFKNSLHVACPHLVVARLSGPAGVLLIHAVKLPFKHKYEVLGEDAVSIHLVMASQVILAVHGVYFPFASGNKKRVALTLEMILTYAEAHVPQVVIGDLNLGALGNSLKAFSEIEAPLYQAGLIRIETPATGFDPATHREQGWAQAIWLQGGKAVEVMGMPSVEKGWEVLSNCHRPLSVMVSTKQSHAMGAVVVPPSIRGENRGIPNRHVLATALNKAGRSLEGLAEQEVVSVPVAELLETTLLQHTSGAVKSVSTTLKWRKLRQKAQDARGGKGLRPYWRGWDRPTMSIREKVRKRIRQRKRFIMRLAVTDSTALARKMFSTSEPIIADNPNEIYAKALEELSFLRRAVDHGFHEGLPDGLRAELQDIARFLGDPFTSTEVRDARKKLRRTTTYSDYPAIVANLMGEPALEMVARAFTQWLKEPEAEVIVPVIGIERGKP